MGRWQDTGGYRPSGSWNREPQEERYFGMTPTQFNLAFFAALGAVAMAAFLYFGGVGAVQDYLGDDDPSSEQAVQRQVTPTPTGEAGPEPTAIPEGEDDGSAVSDLLNTFGPSTVLSGFGSGEALEPSEPIEPSDPFEQEAAGPAAEVLLKESDLPPGFARFGEMSFSVPTGDGTGDMVSRVFTNGDLLGGDLGTMVTSTVIEGSGVGDELASELSQPTEADIDEMAAALEESGTSLQDFRLLDASGLGDFGIGMHYEMDFGGLTADTDLAFDEGVPQLIAWDMYMFAQGDRLLMVMVMWPGDSSSGVDSRALADIMDGRAPGVTL